MIVYEFKVKGKEVQYRAIDEAIRTSQFIQNKCLRYWMENKGLRQYDLNKYCAVLAAEFPFAEELNSMARQSAAERTWSAIARFFDNCKKKIKGKKGFPKFKKHCRSVEYKTSGWKLSATRKAITFRDGKNIGTLKLKGTYDLNCYDIKQIKRVRLVHRADGYYAQFAIDVKVRVESKLTKKMVGLDLGLKFFIADNEGNTEPCPQFYRKSEKQLNRANRKKSKKFKRGAKPQSKNYHKARSRYARKHLGVRCDSLRVNHGIKPVHNLSWQTVITQDDRTLGLIRVPAPSARLRHDSLPAHTDPTRFRESEAGDRAQSDIRCGVTLALMGSSYGENRALKSDPLESGAQHKITDLTGASFPPHLLLIAARVKGIQWSKWLHLTGRTI